MSRQSRQDQRVVHAQQLCPEGSMNHKRIDENGMGAASKKDHPATGRGDEEQDTRNALPWNAPPTSIPSHHWRSSAAPWL